MTLFFMFILAGMAIIITVLPLVKPPLEVGPVRYTGEDEIQLLRRKKEIVYGNIKDLDFEFKMGKLGDDDYQRLRNELKSEAALLVGQMSREKKGQSAEAAIEAEILARRSRRAASSVTPKVSEEQHQCPQCKTPHGPQSKFCSECGCKLST